MSFLDNLESNLKALEGRDEGLDDARHRETERERMLAAAPWADRLKHEPFAGALMREATLAGRERRMKVNLAWIGTTLRLEARGHRLELRPTPGGVVAVFLREAEEIKSQPVDLADDPRQLTGEWMAVVDATARSEQS
jgi:hypothetical protein